MEAPQAIVPTTALHCAVSPHSQSPLLFAGSGSRLAVYHLGPPIEAALCGVWKVLEVDRVHGIEVSEESGQTDSGRVTVTCFGGREVAVCELGEEGAGLPLKLNLTIQAKIKLPEWVFCVKLLTNPDRIACLTAHNTVSFYSLSTTTGTTSFTHKISCVQRPLLFSGAFAPTSPSATHLRIASGTATAALILWKCPADASSEDTEQSVTQSLKGHPGAAFDLAFSPDGQRLASVSDDRTLRVWNLSQEDSRPETVDETVLWGHTGRIWRVTWYGAHTLVTTGEDGRAIGWTEDAAGKWGLSRKYAEGHDSRSLWSVAVDAERGLVATGGADGGIRLWPAPDTSGDDTLHIASPDRSAIKILAVSSSPTESDLIYVTRGGALYHHPTFPSKSPPASLHQDKELLGGTKQCRACIHDRCAYVVTATGELLRASLSGDQTSPRVDVLPETTPTQIVVISVGDVAVHMMLYDRKRAVCRIFEILSRNDPPVLLFNLSLKYLESISSMHLSTTSSGQFVCFVGDSSGQIASWELFKSSSPENDPHNSLCYPKYISRTHGDGIADIRTSTQPDSNALVVRTVGRDGRAMEHIHQAGSLILRDSRAMMHGWLERMLGEGKNEVMVGFEDAQCKVVRRDGTLLASWPCGAIPSSWAARMSTSGPAFFYQQGGKIVCKLASPPHNLYPPVLQAGGHGREIRCLKMKSLGEQGILVASGAENGVLRITHYPRKGSPSLVFSDTTLDSSLKSLVWLNSPDSSLYLVVAGSRELLQIFKINVLTVDFGVNLAVLPWLTCSPVTESSQIRIMEVGAFEEVDGKRRLCVAYSDGVVRTWTCNFVTRECGATATLDFHRCCVLSTKCVELFDGRQVMLSGATDGSVAVTVLPPTVDGQVGVLEPDLVLRPHQSGVNCLEAYFQGDNLIVITGGDDATLVVSLISVDKPGGRMESHELFSLHGAHSSSITGLSLLPITDSTPLLFTASIDQRIASWNIGSNGKLELKERWLTPVGDVGDLEVARVEDREGEVFVGVCGIGMEVGVRMVKM